MDDLFCLKNVAYLNESKSTCCMTGTIDKRLLCCFIQSEQQLVIVLRQLPTLKSRIEKKLRDLTSSRLCRPSVHKESSVNRSPPTQLIYCFELMLCFSEHTSIMLEHSSFSLMNYEQLVLPPRFDLGLWKVFGILVLEGAVFKYRIDHKFVATSWLRPNRIRNLCSSMLFERIEFKKRLRIWYSLLFINRGLNHWDS